MMMMTFPEVKGHQRSNVVNYALWFANLVRKKPDASYDDNEDFHGGQRSSEIKCGILTLRLPHLENVKLLILQVQ